MIDVRIDGGHRGVGLIPAKLLRVPQGDGGDQHRAQADENAEENTAENHAGHRVGA